MRTSEVRNFPSLKTRLRLDVKAILSRKPDNRATISDVSFDLRHENWKVEALADLESTLNFCGFSITVEKNYRNQNARFVRVGNEEEASC